MTCNKLLVIFFIVSFIILIGIGCTFEGQIVTTDNATGNTSTLEINVTASPLDEIGSSTTDLLGGLESLEQSAGDAVAVLEFAAGAAIVIAMLFLVLWRGDIMLYFIAGLITFFIAITWSSRYTGVSYCFCVLSSYEMLQGLILAISTDVPARGISQFKGIINKVRSWF